MSQQRLNKVFSIDWQWSFSCPNEWVRQIEFKEKKCEEMNKSLTYEYIMESSLAFNSDSPYKITIKVYKRV